MFRTLNAKRSLTALKILLVVLCVYSAILFKHTHWHADNLARFIHIGEYFTIPGLIGPGTTIIEGCVGYDGQFYYYMTQDLLIRSDAYKYFDSPGFRYQRIMYSLLAAVLSFGHLEAVPFTLIAVNIAFILIGTAFIIAMLYEQGMNPWFALFYGFFSGFLLAVFKDLCDPVCMGFMVAALFFYSRHRFFLCALLFSCTILTREGLVLMIPVLFVDRLFLKRDIKTALIALLPLFPFIAWQLYIFTKTGRVGFKCHHVVSPLFAGMTEKVHDLFANPRADRLEQKYLLFFLAASIFSVVLSAREIIRSKNEISMGFLGFSFMPFVMSSEFWWDPWGYGRVLLPAAVFLLLSFIRSRNRDHLMPLTIHATMFFMIAFWHRLIR